MDGMEKEKERGRKRRRKNEEWRRGLLSGLGQKGKRKEEQLKDRTKKGVDGDNGK